MSSTAAFAFLCLASVQSPPAPASAATSASFRIEIRAEPFLDLWFAARAAGSAPSEAPELLAPAAKMFEALDADLGSPLAWAPIEGRLATCASVADARAALAELPESAPRKGGDPVALRARALELVDALAPIETAFRETLWPADEARLAIARRDLEEGLMSRWDEVAARHTGALGFEGLELAVPCVLVAKMPAPGAVTHRGAGGRGVCFVGVDALARSELYEVVLHEATHALDVARDGDVFDDLRARLEAAGVARGDKVWRDAPHALMFRASAATIRVAVDADHVDHGRRSGYYGKIGATDDVVRRAWSALQSGEARDAVLARAVTELTAAKPADAPAKPAEAPPKR